MPFPSTSAARVAARPGSPERTHHSYRPDVDGLRAVAVLAVVLYHAGIPGISGGFVGVDVFFVISGYLITGIVAREVIGGRFSLARFYERRARRILPALFVMITVVAVPAYFLLIPQSLAAYGRSAAAAALSVSNVSFWRSTDYFAPGAGQLPLLHTWSLGVEEQFYLALPLYLLLLRRHLVRHPVLVIGPPIVLSFAVAVLWTTQGQTAEAFYLPFGRAWELGAGAALAMGVLPTVRSLAVARALGWAGLLAIVVSAFVYEDRTLFPGTSALLPVLGAAAIIHAGSGGTAVGASRLLALKPFVAVGLVSYSLYLWHWPVLVMARVVAGRDLPLLTSLALVPVMGLLAWASWRFVERPFRRPRQTWSPRRVLVASAAGVVAISVAGVGLLVGGGLPGRFPEPVRALATASSDTNPDRARCDSPGLQRIRSGDLCVLGAPGVAPTVALVGDSFGDALAPGVVEAAAAQGRSVLVMTHSGCRPLVGLTGVRRECSETIDAVAERISSTPSITSVVLVGRWTTMVEGVRLGAFAGVEGYLTDAQSRVPSTAENSVAFERSLARTVEAFGDKDVWVVAGVPEQEVLVPQALTSRSVLGLPPLEGVSRSEYDARQAQTLRLLAEGAGYRVLDAGPLLCPERTCLLEVDGRSLYADDNHLSRTGAERLAPLYAPVFEAQG